MKYLKYIFLLLLLVIVGGSIYIATLDSSFEVLRSRKIKAPVEVVFNDVVEFRNWPKWSPWIEKDTLTEVSYGEKSEGEGAVYSWKSDVVGEGTMKTLTVVENSEIDQKIQFIQPMESTSDIFWKFDVEGDSTNVVWGMKGEQSFKEKAYMLFAGGMDKMVGPDFERGLQKLDSVVQADMKKYSVTVNGLTTHGGGYYLYNSASSTIDDMPAKMAEMMPKVGGFAQKNKIPMAGAPFVLYHKYDVENNAVVFSCAVPVADRVITESSDILTGMLPPFYALKTTLKGDYKNLEEAWNTAMKYIAGNGLNEAVNKPSIEVYQTDPMNAPNPADWITEIYIPIQEEP